VSWDLLGVRRDGVLTVVEILGLCRVNVASARAHSQSRGVLPRWRGGMSYEDDASEVVKIIESVAPVGRPGNLTQHLGTWAPWV